MYFYMSTKEANKSVVSYQIFDYSSEVWLVWLLSSWTAQPFLLWPLSWNKVFSTTKLATWRSQEISSLWDTQPTTRLAPVIIPRSKSLRSHFIPVLTVRKAPQISMLCLHAMEGWLASHTIDWLDLNALACKCTVHVLLRGRRVFVAIHCM